MKREPQPGQAPPFAPAGLFPSRYGGRGANYASLAIFSALATASSMPPTM